MPAADPIDDSLDDEASAAAPRPPGTLKIGRLAGADVLLSPSWFLIAGLLAVLFAPMVVTWYLLQAAVDDGWRTAWVWSHGICSSLWVLAYVVHQVPRRRIQTSQ